MKVRNEDYFCPFVLALVENASGGEANYYGRQGEVTKTVRTVMASVADIRTYVYGATYDSWNRVQTMTYPDGEVVTYHYNAAGQVESMTSNKQGRQSVIVDRIGYDKEGHTVYTKLGNGTETTYTYDKQRERLQAMNLTADGQTVMENRYRYDAVDNILGITNAANPTSLTKLNKAKLGGRSSHTYEYDELNRLIHASGKAKHASYDMVMSFGRMSEPLTKVQKVDSTTTAKSYNFAYKYEDNNHPTAPTQIGHDHYTYDANGNPTLVTNDSANTTREMYWDEDNRLMVLSDNGKTSRYTYNAAGERIMKSYGTMEGVYINGAPQGITFHETDNFTLYPASILSVNKNRFTKHYFLGDKRVASRIGTGLFNNVYGRNGSYVTAGQQDYAERMNQIQKQKETYYKQQGIAPGVPTMKGAYGDPENTGVGYNTVITELGDHSVPEGWIQTPKHNTTEGNEPGAPISWNDPTNPENPQPGYGYVDNDTTKEETFFYHSDHLGSTSYITDSKGNITQYDAYLPYGELLVDEHSSSEDMPYKFNGKEMDAETGLYYYGARYLNPVTCLWYGVDPLAEKYKEIGSYVYCADNPINLFDPDGQKFIYNAQGKFLRKEGKDNLVYIERDGKLTQLIDHGNGMTDEQFNIAAHIVDVESSDAPNESLWIAHAANNAVDDKDVNYAHVRVKGGPRVKNHSLYEQLNDQNYSTTPASARVAYDKDYLTSSTRTTARAGIIDALQSDIDPTHGATLWDGTDFATKGLSHPKFRQYNKITIPDNIRKDYVYRNESYLQRIKSKMQVSPVFERNGIFIHDGKSTAKFSLIATGTFGRTIFWHKK
ncbi:type IV secretion protein Rhs [Prevotella jejuni]|uniref:RHS repeat-associated core domain-containing protein n=4 Tax=Prevotella TaxID=838 RepID=A0A2K9H7G8_9BACT|nr:type IV secretion protein Rhs [Prevotella jejuni]SNR79738.1 RHS repeat-associated core domain-containing protein [Prevotella jejuni]